VDDGQGKARLMTTFEVATIDPMVGLGKLSIEEKDSLAHEKGTSKQMTIE
jgi:hypothetical protein